MFTSPYINVTCYKLQVNSCDNHYMCENVTLILFYSKINNHLLRPIILFYYIFYSHVMLSSIVLGLQFVESESFWL